MKPDRFYLACLRDTVGTNVSFHGNGYTSDIDAAKVYTREQAQRAWNSLREFDLPLAADQVDSLSVWHVDCQYLPVDTQVEPGCTRYVAFRSRYWDGNDVYFVSNDNEITTDFSKAKIYSEPTESNSLVWIPFDLADKHKRRTFCVHLINKRRMVQGAGIVTPEHHKRTKSRKANPMTRSNCEFCGKLFWSYNPYEEGCSDVLCEGHRYRPEQY